MITKVLFSLLLKTARKCASDFDEATKKVRETQNRLLLNKIKRNAASDFGKDHFFGEIKDISAFRKNVRIADYSYYSAYVNRVRNGDMRALFGPSEKLVMFALTSGTTHEPKFIPVTATFLKDYKRGWLIWGHYIASKYPLITKKMLLPITSAYDEFYTERGVPCGAISGLSAEKQNYVTCKIYAVPSEIYKIKDPAAKYYLMMRTAIEKDIGSITTANPSTVLALVKVAQTRPVEIIRDIHDGKISEGITISDEHRKRLEKCLQPNPGKARELEGYMKNRGELLPMDYWKGLQLVSNWKGGSLSSYLELYPKYFADTPVRDLGLIASEGRMTIPMEDAGASGVLDITSHFFEFIPEEDVDKQSPAVLCADELSAGKKYFIILTTSSGLYRYNIHDLVEVTGFYNGAPMIRFLNKGRHIASITGEKITEFQVVESVKAAAKEHNMDLDTFTFVPCPGHNPHYALIVEEGYMAGEKTMESLVEKIDKNLREMNIEYDGKRHSNRLHIPALYVARDNSFENLKMRHVRKQGGRMEQYKNVFLSPDSGHVKEFEILNRFMYNATSA